MPNDHRTTNDADLELEVEVDDESIADAFNELVTHLPEHVRLKHVAALFRGIMELYGFTDEQRLAVLTTLISSIDGAKIIPARRNENGELEFVETDKLH